MKIAVFHELPIGGARDAVYKFSSELKENKINVDLYYVSSVKESNDFPFYGKINYFKIVPKIWTGKNWINRLYNDTIFLYKLNKLHKRIAILIDLNKYDFIFVHGSQFIEAPFILKHLKSKTIFYCHDPNYRIVYEDTLKLKYTNIGIFKQCYENINRYLRKILDKYNFSCADYVIANSKFAQKIIYKTYKKKSIVIYPGVNVNFFKPLKRKKDIDVFYIGSYSKIDGYDLLQRAKNNLSKKIKIFTKMNEDGWVDTAKIREYYSRSKIVVAIAHNEPFGSVPIEAFSSGVPVIAVKEGGHIETVVHNINGLLVKRNSRQFVNAIKYLLKNDKIRINMGKNARKLALNKWSWKSNGKLLANYFLSLYESKK